MEKPVEIFTLRASPDMPHLPRCARLAVRKVRRRLTRLAYAASRTRAICGLIIFCAFSVLYLKEGLKWNHLVGFALIAGAAFFIFKEW
jgi:uncharacterized protein (DUF486 family)